jgi:hypothetical protein
MFSQFITKTEPNATQPQSISLEWKFSTVNEAPNTEPEEEVSGSVAQLTEEENKLRLEKQQLIQIMDELENRLTFEIKTKKASIVNLKTEISSLRDNCETIAKALNIPVIK